MQETNGKRTREECDVERDVAEILDITTADDRVDAWLAKDGGRAPGGEYIVYPVETSDLPWEPATVEDDADFVRRFYIVYREVERLDERERRRLIDEARAAVKSALEDSPS